MQFEKLLAERLFGEDAVFTNLPNLLVSFPLVIFCSNRMQPDFLGDVVKGFSVKFCNDFFPTPTDVGICLTKNLVLKNVLDYALDKEYEWYMESDNQNHTRENGIDDYWNGNTFILSTNAFNVEDHPDTMTIRTDRPDNYITMQIHPNYEFAQILLKNGDDTRTEPVDLEPGYEYSIEISPQGHMVSDSYKALPLEERSCQDQENS